MRTAILVMLLLFYPNTYAEGQRVVMETTMGSIVLELDEAKAPVSVGNFLGYVDKGAYDGTIFHRVIPGFMIQGGGLNEAMDEIPGDGTILNEADNGLKNQAGTIAMARYNEIDTASRQFFINVNDNVHLDNTAESCTREQLEQQEAARQRGLYKPVTCKGFGYAVFGRVVEGLDVVGRIETVETHSASGHANVPVAPVVITSVRRVESGEE